MKLPPTPSFQVDMARGQEKSDTSKYGRQPPPPVGKQPQGINKQQAVRKSLRLQQPREQSIFKCNLIPGFQAPPSLQRTNVLKEKKVCATPSALLYR